MTAAKLSSHKCESKSPLVKIKKYGKRLIDAIDSIKIFSIIPLLTTCIKFLLSLAMILIQLFMISPPVGGLFLAAASVGFLSIIGTYGTLLLITPQPNDTLSCIDGVQSFHGELQVREFTALLLDKLKIMWILWSIIGYTLPELIYSMVCFIRAKNKPSTGQFLSVIIPETFHTIGIALMIFEVLPKLNYNYCVLFVIWCVIEWGLHAAMSAFCEMKSTKIKSWLIFVDIVCLGIFINFTIFNPFDGINRNNTDCWIAMLALALLHCGLWQDDSYSTFNLTDYLPPFINSHRILEPVKDSIYAWVSLWKIIVFFASSFAIFVINHGTTTHLFEMFGPALSLDNTTEIIPRQEVDFNDPQYRNELNLIIRLLFPVMILSFQLTMALFINKRTESVITSILDRFISPSIMGLSIPLLITIEFILFSGYFRSVNYYLLYRIPLGEQLTNLFSDIHIPDVVSKFISIDSLYNWDANLLRLSFCWIVLHFIVVVYGADVIDCYYKYYDDETLVIVKVEVIPKNEKVEEKENLTAV